MGKKDENFKGDQSEKTLRFDDSGILRTLLGEMDKNARYVEKELDLKISHDGQNLSFSGADSDVDLAFNLFEQLKELAEKGENIWETDIQRALKMLSGNQKLRIEDLFRDQVKIAGRKHSIVPKTFRQKLYLESIRTHDIIFGVGPAGTGKTYLAMAAAVSALLKKEVKRVVLCRPAVEAGEKLGFLPGDMAEKVNPYLRPLYDALHDMVEMDRAKEMVEKGQIEVAPLAFMRGRTLSHSFVILDEAQNTTPVQMKMFLTRLGFGSKCLVTGDPTQIDLPRGIPSGLSDALNIVKRVPAIAVIDFTEDDVIRHPLVSEIVKAYERRDSSN
jgi:phosphate starvation-inducible PhoH-like protein